MVNVSLSQFEGPLDLLLHLISNAKIDIKDIFVSQITDQYLEAMGQMDELDMDAASEFLAMAATLIEIKSRALLPKPVPVEPGEESPEEELVRRLTEYKAFKEATQEFAILQSDARGLLNRLPEERVEPGVELDMKGLTTQALFLAFQKVLQRMKLQELEAQTRPREIRKEQYSMQACMFKIQSALGREKRILFESLFEQSPCVEEVVGVFTALLELIRLDRVAVMQKEAFGELVLLAKGAKRHGN